MCVENWPIESFQGGLFCQVHFDRHTPLPRRILREPRRIQQRQRYLQGKAKLSKKEDDGDASSTSTPVYIADTASWVNVDPIATTTYPDPTTSSSSTEEQYPDVIIVASVADMRANACRNDDDKKKSKATTSNPATIEYTCKTLFIPEGNENVDGNFASTVGFSGAEANPRVQQLFTTTSFPQRPVLITQFAFRPNEDTVLPEISFQNVEVCLSMFSGGTLSTTYAENVDAASQLCWQYTMTNQLVISSQLEFVIEVPGMGFLHDASAGNLLLDINVGDPQSGVMLDAVSGSNVVQRVIGQPGSASGNGPQTIGFVTEFTLEDLSESPSSQPSTVPSGAPSSNPSAPPSAVPSTEPSSMPSAAPSAVPSTEPSSMPSAAPSSMPSTVPSAVPSTEPSSMPSAAPSSNPSAAPSSMPSAAPSSMHRFSKVIAPEVVTIATVLGVTAALAI